VVNTPGKFFLDIDYLRTQLDWDIKEDLRLVFLGGFEDMDRESAQDMELSLNAWDQAMFFLPGTGSRSWSGEIQLQSYGAKKFNWIAGMNYFEEKTTTLGYFDNAIGEKSLWDQPDRSTNAGALFAQGTYSYSPKWHLTLGYRYSDETKEDKQGRTYSCTPENGCAPPYLAREQFNSWPVDYFENPDNYRNRAGDLVFFENDNKGSWSHNDFRVGLDWQKNENTLVYGYLATGFKSGGIGDVVNYTDLLTGEPQEVRTAFGPEEVTTLEIGTKLRLLDRKLNLKACYFLSDYEDMQYAAVGAIAFSQRWGPIYDDDGNLVGFGPVPQPIVAYYTQNVPGARIQGIEVEYDSRPWQGGRISGYASWLDTKITEDWNTIWGYDAVSYFGLEFEEALDPTNPELQVNLKGNEMAVSPPFKLNITIDHAFLFLKHNTTVVPWVTAHYEAGSYLTVWNVDKHTDDMNFNIRDEDIKYTDDRREAWGMVHAGVRAYRGNWMAEVFGYNLTNEVVQYWGGAAENVAKGSFSTPRNYGFQVGKKFNF
jgi:iron complex outermembrane receptor protein